MENKKREMKSAQHYKFVIKFHIKSLVVQGSHTRLLLFTLPLIAASAKTLDAVSSYFYISFRQEPTSSSGIEKTLMSSK